MPRGKAKANTEASKATEKDEQVKASEQEQAQTQDAKGQADQKSEFDAEAFAQQQAQTNEQVFDILAEISSKMESMSAPMVNTHEYTDPSEHEQSIGSAEFNDDGELEMPTNMNPDSPEFHDKATRLSFMNQDVTIELHQVTGKEAPVVPLSVNGNKLVLERGRQYTLKRYMVETLAMARPVEFTNVEYQDSDGTQKVRYDASSGMRFPFHVVEDSKAGREWFRHITRPTGIQQVHV